MPFFRSLEYLVDCCYGLIPRKNPSIDQCAKAKVIVHRGWTERGKNIENTLPAFRDCLGRGLFGIEFDVRWTKDLVPVVHHDETMKRVFNENIRLKDLSFSELRSSFPLVPTLAEVVHEFGGKIHLLVELKLEDFPDIGKQREALKDILSGLDEGEDYHLLSLFCENFFKFNNFKKSTMVLVSTTNTSQISREVKQHGFGGFMGHYVLMKQMYFNDLKNVIIGTGFPRNKNSFKREINRNEVDWIFTNKPSIFIKYRKGRLKRLSLNSRF